MYLSNVNVVIGSVFINDRDSKPLIPVRSDLNFLDYCHIDDSLSREHQQVIFDDYGGGCGQHERVVKFDREHGRNLQKKFLSSAPCFPLDD